MDRNLFFVGRKEENYFYEGSGSDEDLLVDQKPVTPEQRSILDDWDHFEREV